MEQPAAAGAGGQVRTASCCSSRSPLMTARQRRMMWVALIVLGVGAAAAFGLNAFQDNLLYFYSPSDVSAGKAPSGRSFRVGGMVTEGSFHRPTGSLQATFVVTDFAHDVTVRYSGVLPDLFRE